VLLRSRSDLITAKRDIQVSREDDYYTLSQTARIMKKDKKSIEQMIRNNELAAKKEGRRWKVVRVWCGKVS
jgi:hypothetical protein